MKTTRNGPRARKERALARSLRSATRAADSSHSHGQWSSTHRHNLDATRFARALDRLNNRFHGFLTKKGFKAWDEL